MNIWEKICPIRYSIKIRSYMSARMNIRRRRKHTESLRTTCLSMCRTADVRRVSGEVFPRSREKLRCAAKACRWTCGTLAGQIWTRCTSRVTIWSTATTEITTLFRMPAITMIIWMKIHYIIWQSTLSAEWQFRQEINRWSAALLRYGTTWQTIWKTVSANMTYMIVSTMRSHCLAQSCGEKEIKT